MDESDPPSGRQYTLNLSIVVGTVFAAIVIVLSGTLLTMNYITVADLGKREAIIRFDQVGGAVRSTLASEISLIDTVLDTASLTVETDIPKEELGTLLLNMLMDMRSTTPAVTGVEIGEADGGMILVRAVESTRTDDDPEGAAYEIALIYPGTDSHPATEKRTFIDRSGHVMLALPPGKPRFDPRTRPWYIAGVSDPTAHIIPPYVFAHSSTLGVSLVRASRITPGTVIAFDATLADLDKLLRRVRTSSDMELVAFLRSGLLLAHADGAMLRPDEPPPPRLDQTGSPVRTALLRISETTPAGHLQDIVVDGERYLAQVAPAIDALPEVLIGIAYPYERVLGPAGIARRDGLIVSIAALALSLIGVLMAARRIARPLTALTGRMRRIMALKLQGSPPPHSAIREIDELSTAIGTMEVALGTFARYVPRQIVRGIVNRRLSPELGGRASRSRCCSRMSQPSAPWQRP